MFSRRKTETPKRCNHDLSQFGLMEIPDDFNPSGGVGGSDDCDSDLEAELAAITSGGGGRIKAKSKQKVLPPTELDAMVAESLRDIPSDDEDLSGDIENDPDLLGELRDITGGELKADEEDTTTPEVSNEVLIENDSSNPVLPTTTVDTIGIIKQRIEMYKQAETTAKASGEAAKARRFNRGLKTLSELLKQATAGKQISTDDIPPVVSVKPIVEINTDDVEKDNTAVPQSVPVRPAAGKPDKPVNITPPEVSTPSDNNQPVVESSSDTDKNQILQILQARQKEYKVAALNYKRAGDTANALQFVKIVKQFDVVIQMCSDGQPVDLSDMPPPPDQFLDFMTKMQAAAIAAADTTAVVADTPTVGNEIELKGPVSSSSMLEALQQRLDKYKSVEETAKAEGNSSKARRFGRIVKQYEDAMRQYKAGRPVAYDELPIPPGFGPLPISNNEAPAKTVQPPPSATPELSPTPTSTVSSPGTTSSSVSQDKSAQRSSPVRKHDLTTRTSGNQQTNNLAEQQMKILLDRQKEFKVAAIEAKKAGEIDQAKEYLKIYKGFEALLNAASSGLPVDLTTLPVPPSQRDNLEESFAIVTTEDCEPNDDISDINIRIEEQLAKQLMMCKNTRDHHKAMGDIAGMNRFENLALTVQKDLDLVRYSKRKNIPLPKFHYEMKSFNIVHCNTDLTDNELEIMVVRGINYNVANPKEVDTYVKIEFPLLNDEVFKTKTALVRDTDCPDYNQRVKVEIVRGNRQFQRIFKRHGVKFEVYSRGGFLRSDILIGTVTVKLQALETKCDIHDTFDLMDGRKAVGGKLEIKLRLRNPLLTKQIEHINEKWLVLDA